MQWKWSMNKISTSDKLVVFQQWHCQPWIGVVPSVSCDGTKSECVGGVVNQVDDVPDDDAELMSVDNVDPFTLNLSDTISNDPWWNIPINSTQQIYWQIIQLLLKVNRCSDISIIFRWVTLIRNTHSHNSKHKPNTFRLITVSFFRANYPHCNSFLIIMRRGLSLTDAHRTHPIDWFDDHMGIFHCLVDAWCFFAACYFDDGPNFDFICSTVEYYCHLHKHFNVDCSTALNGTLELYFPLLVKKKKLNFSISLLVPFETNSFMAHLFFKLKYCSAQHIP